MKVSVITLGCKVNECESRSLISSLRLSGCEVTEELCFADAYIINTCSVTGEADRKSRQAIGKAAKCNPNAKIYVCGCSSQRDSDCYKKFDNVVYISGNGRKNDILQYVMSDIAHENRIYTGEVPSYFEEMALPSHEKTRDFIKVQDGCNNFCSYCIIPYVRGRSRSRSLESIVSEAKEAARNTKEIVLTGIDVSSYGKDTGSSLRELVLALSDLPVRKRMSSFECTVIDEALLDALGRSGFCDHFHLSLQSGCDNVLRSMNRKYTTERYAEIVKMIRDYFPNAGITTDVIVGFPTESESDFSATCDFVRAVGFSDLHVFPYSERKGTRAAGLPQLPMSERRARARELSLIKAELKRTFLQKQIGRTLNVYFEETQDGLSSGYAENYVRVYGEALSGEIKKINISELYKEGVR